MKKYKQISNDQVRVGPIWKLFNLF